MNFITTFARSLKRQKFVFALNVTGLSLGICCAYLILVWAADELTFDKFHANYDSIYLVQIVDKNLSKSTSGPPPLGPALLAEYPEVVGATRYLYHSGGELLEYQQNKLYAKGIEVDTSFFSIFSFPVEQGDKTQFFNDPNSILLTRDLAEKLFGKQDPIGKQIKFRNEHTLEVKGILKNIPQNSSMNFAYAVPLSTFYKPGGDEWGMWNPATFIRLSRDANTQAVAQKMRKFPKIHERKERELALVPFGEVHFNLEDNAFFQKYTNYIHVQALIIGAIFILIVSCINYINLSIAISSKRAKEVGVKKALGAEKSLLTWQFFKESLLQGGLAVSLGLVLLVLFRNEINGFAQKNIISLINAANLGIFIGIGLLIAIVSGFYPALFLASFPPLNLLKNNLRVKNEGKKFDLRNVLVISQFTVAIIVLICTVILSEQIDYIKNKDLGYNKDHLVAIPLDRGGVWEKYDAIKNELKGVAGVENVSIGTFRYIYFDEKLSGWDGNGDDQFIKGYGLAADQDFVSTMDLKLAGGRFFNEKFNDEASIVINEEAVRQMNLREPVGKTVTLRNKKHTIVGVLKDFNYWGVDKKVEPVFVFLAKWGDVFVRMQPDKATQTLAQLQTVFTRFNPAFPFEYHFINEEVEALYRKERTVEHMLTFFAFLCIFLSSLGLYALSAFVVREKMKEVAIKKVFGASAYTLVNELSLLFLIWILIAFIIAAPIAVLCMHKWLSNYAYHTSISATVLVGTFLLSTVVALLAIIGNVIKASIASPLQTIRTQ